MLRKMNGYSQEEIAGRIGISRQAYAKWESGETIPDVDKAAKLAKEYKISLDALIKNVTAEGIGMIPPAPKGKNLWGSLTLGDRGQIVIPKAARDKFDLKGGDRLILLSNDNGLALVPAENFEKQMQEFMDLLSK
ncbi:MAG: helix-turn-helix domain-containing protein [Erysipelotrichaceae bacterium]|nr:helix-turn-helix domain-containing protein [Erysipelotrichaceae bacterium]